MTRFAVSGALDGLGFTTEIMEVTLDLASIETLPSRRPLLVFNLVDAIDGDGRLAPLVPARLDALGIAYTGCSTSALFETLSKVGTKLRLAHAGLPTPEWSTDGTGLNGDARVIVKAVWEHGSLGLDETSVMRCADAPRVVAARTLRLKTEHFAEAYIEGREFHVALLERISGVEVLPIAEILFGGLRGPRAQDLWLSTPNGRLIAQPISARCAASVWNRTSPNLPRRSSSSRWLAGPCSGLAAMRASIFVSIRPARPSSST